MIQRRGLLTGLGALLAMPAVIRTPGLLMPVKVAPQPTLAMIMRQAIHRIVADEAERMACEMIVFGYSETIYEWDMNQFTGAALT